MKKLVVIATAFAPLVHDAGTAFAQPGTGPVAVACAEDMVKVCPGIEHGGGKLRACLEANRAKVSEACKVALDSTGPGKGMGQGMGKQTPN